VTISSKRARSQVFQALAGSVSCIARINQIIEEKKSDTPREAGGLMSWAASKME